MDRRRHQLVGLVGRVAEHDALVARALLLAVGGVDALGDVLGLAVDVVVDAQGRPVEALLLVADVPHAVADDLLDPAEHLAGAAHLAADDDPVGGGEGLAGDPRLGLARSRKASSTASEIRSQTLSGCPSDTDSEVKK